MTTNLSLIESLSASAKLPPIPIMIANLNDNRYYNKLAVRRQYNQKFDNEKFQDFNDLEMIYYYVHDQKNIDDTKNKSEKTRTEYLRELLQFSKHIVEYSQSMGIEIYDIKEGSLFKSLDETHLENYQEWLVKTAPRLLYNKERFTATTIAKKTSIIKSFFRFLFNSRYIEKDVAAGLKVATVKREELPNRDLGPSEVLELLNYLKEENHPILFGIIHLLVTTGIRNIEFCRLRVKDLKKNYATGDYYLEVLGKGNKNRICVVKPKVFDSIVEFRKVRGLPTFLNDTDNSHLFTTNTGKPYSNSYFSTYIKTAIKRTPLEILKNRENPISPHTMRHAFAIISHYSGSDIYDISRSLGHEQIETTVIYLAKVFEQERNAIHQWKNGVLAEYI
ncbi:tyrosine-type recombinase/integrase [Sutcliffiella sp. NPDC057660]|uniref:tyrosine-type recombinase/integrase n=1 Tax=Sutcliffiella sp. NPDC057660 TaxID=3346199 RepID=UPI0036BCBF82